MLRGELGFEGLILTDAFDMGGILEFGLFEEAALGSVLAGCDIVELWTVPRREVVFPYFVKAVGGGRLSRQRLDASVRRVLIAKARAGLHERKMVDLNRVSQVLNSPENRALEREIAEKAIVLVKNEQNLLPLTGQGQRLAVISVNDDANHIDIAKTLMDAVTQRGDVVMEFAADPDTPAEMLDEAVESADDADLIVVGLSARIFANRGSPWVRIEEMLDFLHRLGELGSPIVLVSFGSPYTISQFPAVEVYMISSESGWDFYSYDGYRPGQDAAAKALFGDNPITGKLAVTIPGHFPFGHGIQLRNP